MREIPIPGELFGASRPGRKDEEADSGNTPGPSSGGSCASQPGSLGRLAGFYEGPHQDSGGYCFPCKRRERLRYSAIERWLDIHIWEEQDLLLLSPIPTFVPIDAGARFVIICTQHRKGGGRMTSSDGSSWDVQRPGEVAET